MNIVTRAAESQKDAEDIARVAGEIWHEHYTPIIGSEQVEYMLANFQSAAKIYGDMTAGGYTYTMAFCDGNLAGYSAVRAGELADGLFLSKLYVKKCFRRNGIASRMVEEWTRFAEKEGFPFLWLTVNRHNTASIAAYLRIGFTVACEMKTDIGGGFVMDDFRMERPVAVQK